LAHVTSPTQIDAANIGIVQQRLRLIVQHDFTRFHPFAAMRDVARRVGILFLLFLLFHQNRRRA